MAERAGAFLSGGVLPGGQRAPNDGSFADSVDVSAAAATAMTEAFRWRADGTDVTDGSTGAMRAPRITVREVAGGGVRLRGVTLMTPDRRRVLFKGLDLDLGAAIGNPATAAAAATAWEASGATTGATTEVTRRLLVLGPSGAGKSGLLRAVAGLWTSGTGLVVRPPSDEMMFLPQRPYW